MHSASTLTTTIRRDLRAAADPSKASGMRSYMKSAIPYLGVQTTPLRSICKKAFASYPLDSFDDWTDAVLRLWRQADYREERYCSIEFCGNKLYRNHQRLAALPMYEEMIVTGAWWDYVDAIAGHRLRDILLRSPKGMSRRMRAWSRNPDMWKRRRAATAHVTPF